MMIRSFGLSSFEAMAAMAVLRCGGPASRLADFKAILFDCG
jgi:hypothetical protein